MLSRHHQVALVAPDHDRVLVVPTDDGPRLPRLDNRWPGHRDLVAAVGDPTALLAGPPAREDDGTVTNVLLGDGTSTLDGASWHHLDDLGSLGLSTESAGTVRRTVAERRDGAPADGRAAWFLPGWRDEVAAFVDRVAASDGFERVGEPEAIRIWSLSAVLRFPVLRAGRPQDLWFKATCDGFHGEPALTAAVCRLEPDLMPQVVAVDAERAWMLMEPIPHADDDTHFSHAPDIARALARLQLETLSDTEHLMAAGAPHRGLDATLEWLHTVVHDSVELPRMAPELRETVVEMEPWLADQLRELWSLGLPDALAHGDLHLGNVAWVDGSPLFFDWTDLCVTHPYLDARHLADSAHETGGEQARQAVWAAYVEPWRQAFPDVDHDRAWELVRAAEAVFQAISYEQIYRAQPEASRWELATVVVGIFEALDGVFRAR
jgi:hypothetical protein